MSNYIDKLKRKLLMVKYGFIIVLRALNHNWFIFKDVPYWVVLMCSQFKCNDYGNIAKDVFINNVMKDIKLQAIDEINTRNISQRY